MFKLRSTRLYPFKPMSLQRVLLWLLPLILFGTSSAYAATLWVHPSGNPTRAEMGNWPVTAVGSAVFTFAVPDDLGEFVSAKLVLLPDADDTIAYEARLAMSQRGLSHDDYTDDLSVDAIDIFKDQVIELNLSPLLPHKDFLMPGLDYLTLQFTAEGFTSGNPSSAAKVLGLRLEYVPKIAVILEEQPAETAVAAAAQPLRGSNVYTLFNAASKSADASLRSASADSHSRSSDEGVDNLAGSVQKDGPSGDLVGEAGGTVNRVGIPSDPLFAVAGDIGVSKGINIHEWSLGTTGDSFQGTGYFFIQDQDTQTLRFAIDQNSGLVNVEDLYASHLGLGTVPDSTYRLKASGLSRFEVGGGSFEFSTPGGWPGIVAFSQNGYRREIALKNDFMWILAGDSSAAPDQSHGIIIRNDGNVGIGTTAPNAKLTVAGRTKTQVIEITGGSDISEGFDVTTRTATEALLPGSVVSIDPHNPGALLVSQEDYDRKVAGIISGAGGINTGMLMGQAGSLASGKMPVALTGRAYCLADASLEPIQPGDLLTTSKTPGHAMKVTDGERAQGAIIGKAMTGLEAGQGLVLVLVSLQ